jgi:hypothetical protein
MEVKMLSEKTWVYWLGLLIVAFSIAGLVRGFAVLSIAPHLASGMANVARLATFAPIIAVGRMIGACVFLAVGVYMMRSGVNVKQ